MEILPDGCNMWTNCTVYCPLFRNDDVEQFILALEKCLFRVFVTNIYGGSRRKSQWKIALVLKYNIDLETAKINQSVDICEIFALALAGYKL